tara:strand:+ start:2536 stop:3099 length:564 start_codon:yes stop_codon:yes gene_type:complete
METVSYKGIEIEINVDDYPSNPRVDWNNAGAMFCRHGSYDLGDSDHGIDDSECQSWSDVEDLIIKKKKPLVILPLYLYDHSGITINTTGFSCQWDSGQVGWTYITKAMCKNMGIDATDIENLIKVLINEVETYDDYISGNAYGFSISNELVEDSCSGYFGYDHEKSGLLDDARAAIDGALSSASKSA